MSASATAHQRTFRGRSLAELLPQIREELGEGAVAVSVRHGRSGGVGGFFAQRCVEVDAVPGDDASAEFERLLAEASAQAPAPGAAETFVPTEWAPMAAEAPGGAAEQVLAPAPRESASALAALFQPDAAPAAPAAPVVVPAPLVALEPTWPDAALAIQRSLTAKGMDPELVAEIIREAVDHLLPFSSEGSLRPLVAGQLARCLPPLPRRRPGRVTIGFVGAGGSGKTRCSARLALAYARRGDRPVACLTLRPRDRGAELMADVSAAGIAVHAIDEPAEARDFLARQPADGVVVGATPGGASSRSTSAT
jgi:flagellar biosynthesis GTPase FlhF